MGLNTVDECIANIDLHYWQLLPYHTWKVSQDEFYDQVKKYENGELELDWDDIEAEVDRQRRDEEEYFDNLERNGDVLQDFHFLG
jgi:hypothetical protein